MKSSNIIAPFLEQAAQSPETIALVQDGQTVSYGQLAGEVRLAAGYFSRNGLKQSDYVLVLMPMGLSLYRVVLGLIYLGAVPVFLDEWVSLARLRACLEVAPCKGFVLHQRLWPAAWLAGSLRKMEVKLFAGKQFLKATPYLQPAPVQSEDTALITFTTGSTGTPKAANRTHYFLAQQLAALSPLTSQLESPTLTMLPIVVLLNLAAGRTTMLPPRAFKAKKQKTYKHLHHALAQTKPASMVVSPAIVETLPDLKAAQDKSFSEAAAHVRNILTGGGPVYPLLAQKLCNVFPNADIQAVYGSTEAEPISHLPANILAAFPLDGVLQKGLPVGMPDASVGVAILPPETKSSALVNEQAFEKAELPSDTTGEIVVSGPHVLMHYINNPAAEAEHKIRYPGGAWHRTGDCGMLDSAGQLFLKGRCTETFFWKSRTYYPTLIAYALAAAAGVESAAVLLWKHYPVVVLEKRFESRKAAASAVLEHLGLKDVAFRFIKKIPRDPRHQTKVDYPKLKKLLE